MNTKQKKKSPIVVIVSISCVLLIAILGSVYYKYDTAQSSESQNDAKNEQQSEKSNDVDDSNTGSSVTKPPEDTPEKKPIDSTTEIEQPSTEPKPEVVNGYLVEQQPATEPTYIKGVLIVNKKIPLPANFNKGEDPAAVAAFEEMAIAAKAEGFDLVAFSGFRSYEYQTSLYDRYVVRDGKDAADRYSARPGYSEHQTGLAFDIGEKGREDLWLTSAFGETEAGQWLVNNAHKYGFILRYPQGKEDITGFMYESWHFRYLDGDLASKIYEAGVTLEEYLGV